MITIWSEVRKETARPAPPGVKLLDKNEVAVLVQYRYLVFDTCDVVFFFPCLYIIDESQKYPPPSHLHPHSDTHAHTTIPSRADDEEEWWGKKKKSF